VRGGVYEDVLGLDVSVADALGVDVGNGSEQLVGVHFDEQVGNHLLHLQVLFHDAVRRVGNEIHHYVQVHLLGLVSVRVERLAHFHAVRVMQHLQNLQLTIFVALVLENLLDRDSFPGLGNRGLEHHAERSVSDNFLSVVSERLLQAEQKEGVSRAKGG